MKRFEHFDSFSIPYSFRKENSKFGLAELIWVSRSRKRCLIVSSGVVAAKDTFVEYSRFDGVSPVN